MGRWLGALGVGWLAACLPAGTVPCDDGTVCPVDRACVPGGCARPGAIEACDGRAEDDPCELPDVGPGVCAGGVCVVPICGDGFVEGAEVCDDGATAAGDGCNSTCTSREICGNSWIDIGEECDDGNTIDGDGCQGGCTFPVCGDGVVDGGRAEACDDGNRADGDGCNSLCFSDETCGNGIRDPGEACDDGASNSMEPDADCRPDCERARCGDLVIDPSLGEACDEGGENAPSPGAACRLNCQPGRCGDGIEDPNEICDDGNLVSGDACSGDCQSREVCGNGYLDPVTEQCDFGSGQSHDGCASTCKLEVAGWESVQRDFVRRDHAVAFDPVRDRLVLFGGQGYFGPLGDTWEFDGELWVPVRPAASPSARYGHGMAYDEDRQAVVLFGGTPDDATYPNDTWAFDGVTWSPVASSASPPGRTDVAMAADPARSRLLLVGGSTGNPVGDTWVLEAAGWRELTTAVLPVPLSGAALAVDLDRDRPVLFGGSTPAFVDSVFELVGDVWVPRAVSGPSAREGAQMVWAPDRRALVMMGGFDGAQQADVWELDGAGWHGAGSLPGPARSNHAMAHVGARLLVVGGYSFGSDRLADTWSRTGTVWAEEVPNRRVEPQTIYQAAAAYDARRGRAVALGVYADNALSTDTWEWLDGAWMRRALAPTPAPRLGQAMVYDQRAQTVLLIGGPAAGPAPAETWAFDGSAWSLLPGTPPPHRTYAAVAYDPARERTVMFGGLDENTVATSSTWEHGPTGWVEVVVSMPPPPRFAAAMAYDAQRERVVLYGGQDFIPPYSDDETWTYDGTRWESLGIDGIGPRANHQLTLDPVRKRVVLTGGTLNPTQWELGPAGWSQVEVTSVLTPRSYHVAWYDPLGQRVVVAGGEGVVGFLRGEQALAPRNALAPPDTCGSSDSDGDGLVGCDDPDCWGRCSPHCPAGTSCVDAFGCGDGACDPLEDYLLCPADCDA